MIEVEKRVFIKRSSLFDHKKTDYVIDSKFYSFKEQVPKLIIFPVKIRTKYHAVNNIFE